LPNASAQPWIFNSFWAAPCFGRLGGQVRTRSMALEPVPSYPETSSVHHPLRQCHRQSKPRSRNPNPRPQPSDLIEQAISVKPTVGTGMLYEHSSVPERFTRGSPKPARPCFLRKWRRSSAKQQQNRTQSLRRPVAWAMNPSSCSAANWPKLEFRPGSLGLHPQLPKQE
jgi:hypothetical protein